MKQPKTYTQNLLSPKWKKKRTAILKRDNNACQNCGDTNQLQVHHCYYESGLKPWEYPDESLVTLCNDCHHRATYRLQNLIEGLEYTLRKKGVNTFDFQAIIVAITDLSRVEIMERLTGEKQNE
jgi:5-methylcytosine-specific restriction endonuclease McrA